MDPFKNKQQPSELSEPQIVAGSDQSSGRFGRVLQFLLRHRIWVLCGVVGLSILITLIVLLVRHQATTQKAPSSTPDSSNTTTPSSDEPKPSTQQNNANTNTTTPSNSTSTPNGGTSTSGNSNSNSSTSTGSSGSTGGSTGGGTTTPPNPCAGTANHVAGGADGTGSCWPGPNNTGVPAGTHLTSYSGPCTITTAGTVIDSKTVNCDLDIQAANVTIKNTKVNGLVVLDADLSGSSGWSMTVQDTEVDAGTQQRAVVSSGNMTVIRANLHGGITGAQCDENSISCLVQDSWLHGQYLPNNVNWHLGGFLSNGGGNITLRHNHIVCDHPVNNLDEGCSGDINFIPNFAAISGALVEHNLLGANIGSAYCTYGGEKNGTPTPHSDHLVYKDNIFQRGTNGICATFGPVTNFDINQPGNQWTNNRYDNGAIVDPVN